MPYKHLSTLFYLTLVVFSTVSLSSPKRIASLAPHLTEWVYALDKGDDIVAVSAYSDYPKQALKHPIIADVNGINLVKLVELNPDLVLLWQANVKLGQVEKMTALGLNVYISNPHTLEDIYKEVNDISKLLAKPVQGDRYINNLKNNLEKLRNKHQHKTLKPTFFQLWHSPLMTVNQNTLINQALNICGLENIFASSSVTYPIVSKEQVMLKMPDYIIVTGDENSTTQSDIWRNMTLIPAVKKQQIIRLNTDALQRYSDRIVGAIEQLCSQTS
jgi:ABC-type Fe3+-hydroxamate transport system substrate-binding protein